MNEHRRDVGAFDNDVLSNDGYLYTTNARLSSRLANRRLTDAVLGLADLRGKRLLDIGCGDGTYTRELAARGGPSLVHGIDPSPEAVRVARERGEGGVVFSVGCAERLPFEDGSFDVAHLRGVLHHLPSPRAALAEAFRVAGTAVVVEPNGYNPVLKLIERFSPYHVAHHERSYAPARLARWIREAGGAVAGQCFVGLVPFFCPDLPARLLKILEPAVERIPLARSFACGVCIIIAGRSPAATEDKR